MKKLYYLIVIVLISSLVLTGCSLLSNVGQVPTNEQSGVNGIAKNGPPPESICINFESTGLGEGESVEGEGKVDLLLNIELENTGKKLILLYKGTGLTQHTAYNTEPGIRNGCLNGDYGFGCPVLNSAGVVDLTTALGNGDKIVFTFPDGVTVSYFSIMMFDYGDWYPLGGTEHKVKLTANGNSEEYLGPHPASTPSYDACSATELGKKKLEISGSGISEVTLEFVSGIDPGIGFDDICFTPEENVCTTNLIAGQTENVGNVEVKYTLTDDFITVTYSTESSDWLLDEIHFHASNNSPNTDWPVNKGGNPIPGHFYKVIEGLGGVNSYDFKIPLVDIDVECGSLYFAAHAKVYWLDEIEELFLVSGEDTDKVYIYPEDDLNFGNPDFSLESGPSDSKVVTYGWSGFVGTLPTGAAWIAEVTNPWEIPGWNPSLNSWRKFLRTFEIPDNAVNLAGTLRLTSDNAEEVKLDPDILGITGVVYGTDLSGEFTSPYTWQKIEEYDLLNKLEPGSNILNILVRNYSGGVVNPTGLIYRLDYEYQLKYEETAWGDGFDFPDAKNWSMYFICHDLVPCPF